jgi:hypothetical protein
MMDLESIRRQVEFWQYELAQICEHENPWSFICIHSLIVFLARAITGGEGSIKHAYIQFILKYFPEEYGLFEYEENKEKDLPLQMWCALEYGLSDSYSLLAGSRSHLRGGRDRPIALAHDGAHLSSYSPSSARIVAGDLLDHAGIAFRKALQEAESDSQLRQSILSFFRNHPPVAAIGSNG